MSAIKANMLPLRTDTDVTMLLGLLELKSKLNHKLRHVGGQQHDRHGLHQGKQSVILRSIVAHEIVVKLGFL